jgi:hypothetical protein
MQRTAFEARVDEELSALEERSSGNEKRLVAPATQGVLEPRMPAPLPGLPTQGDGNVGSDVEAPVGGSHITDVVFGTVLALVSLALMSMILILYVPGKPRQSQTQPKRSDALALPICDRREAHLLELGGEESASRSSSFTL